MNGMFFIKPNARSRKQNPYLKDKTRVLFFMSSLYTGGAEKVLIDLAGLLDKVKYEITILTLLGGGEYEKSLPPAVRYKTIIKSKSKFLRRCFDWLAAKVMPHRIFHRVFIGRRYDVEIAYLEGFPTHVIAHSCNKHSRKLAVIHTSFCSNFDISRHYRAADDCLREYSKFDNVGFVSNKVMTDFEKAVGKLSGSRIVSNVYHPSDIIHKSQESIPESFRPEALKLMAVGRLEKEKGYGRLIESVLALQSEGYHIELWIVGSGSEYNHLNDMAQMNPNAVKLLGFRSNPYPYMKAADLLVCSSFSEGYSTAAAEASILGIPVLTTDCPGMDEILSGGNGMIVENSARGLYDGIKKAASSSSKLKKMKLRALAYRAVYQKRIEANIHIFERFIDG